MIYFDNSATTLKKPYCVKRAINNAIKKYAYNPNRGGYKPCIDLSMKILDCRQKLCEFFNSDTLDNVIFCASCTMAINLAIRGAIKEHGHIITTIYEHNSVLRTLEFLQNLGKITYSTVFPNKNGKIFASDFSKLVQKNTYMIIVNHTSNVTGDTINIAEIGEFCHKNNLIFMVDGAQSAGHEKIDMKKNHINLLAIAGHKGLYGPSGIGALIFMNIKVSPLIFGGTGTYSDKLIQPEISPEGLESGTLNVSGILGLFKGLQYVDKHFDKINNKIYILTKYLIENLKKIKQVTLYSSNFRSGIVALNINKKTSADVCNILDKKYHIYCRCGLHCAPLIHIYKNTLKNGMVRISLSHNNSLYQVKYLIKVIANISKMKNIEMI